MNDLETLRPEVQAAMRTMDGQAGGNRDDAYDVIEAELLRLQSTESRANEWQLRAEKAEAELAAIKARIATAPFASVQRIPDSIGGIERTYTLLEEDAIIELPSLIGKRVRLVVEE